MESVIAFRVQSTSSFFKCYVCYISRSLILPSSQNIKMYFGSSEGRLLVETSEWRDAMTRTDEPLHPAEALRRFLLNKQGEALFPKAVCVLPRPRSLKRCFDGASGAQRLSGAALI